MKRQLLAKVFLFLGRCCRRPKHLKSCSEGIESQKSVYGTESDSERDCPMEDFPVETANFFFWDRHNHQLAPQVTDHYG
jgi:hypothetical protein